MRRPEMKVKQVETSREMTVEEVARATEKLFREMCLEIHQDFQDNLYENFMGGWPLFPPFRLPASATA